MKGREPTPYHVRPAIAWAGAGAVVVFCIVAADALNPAVSVCFLVPAFIVAVTMYGLTRQRYPDRWPRIQEYSGDEIDLLDVPPGRSSFCPRCHYDTRASSNRCPECGCPITPGWMVREKENPELFWSWRKRQLLELERITAARHRSLSTDDPEPEDN